LWFYRRKITDQFQIIFWSEYFEISQPPGMVLIMENGRVIPPELQPW
jgi:hypothetical protein